MNWDSMRAWDVDALPLIFLGLVVPALCAGRFHPGLVRQKVIELSLPLGALGAWAGLVHMLQNLSDPTAAWPAFYTVLLHMGFWALIYFGARLVKMKSTQDMGPLPTTSLLPIVAVLSMLAGWWLTVGMTSGVNSFLSTEAFFCFLLIRATVVEAFRIPPASMEGTLLVGVAHAIHGWRLEP